MAKKARKKVEEDQSLREFAFPLFDVEKFILHELEQSYSTAVALGLALVLAVASWQLTAVGLANPGLGVLPFALASIGLAVVGAFAMIYLIRWIRPKWEEYKRGDWVSLVMIYLLLWAGIWAVLINVWA